MCTFAEYYVTGCIVDRGCLNPKSSPEQIRGCLGGKLQGEGNLALSEERN